MTTLLTALSVSPDGFLRNLKYMGQGMVAILIVMLIIILITTLLNRVFKGKKES